MLGSIGLITDENAAVIGNMHFDPWGKRIDATDWDGAPSAVDIAAIRDITHRGFTNHEMLDAVNLVHMNGRIYDPNLGRMLSADPILSEPSNLQRYNRYSYVNNQPLNFTDPSGYDRVGTPWATVYVWKCKDACPSGDSANGGGDSEEPVQLGRVTVNGPRNTAGNIARMNMADTRAAVGLWSRNQFLGSLGGRPRTGGEHIGDGGARAEMARQDVYFAMRNAGQGQMLMSSALDEGYRLNDRTNETY